MALLDYFLVVDGVVVPVAADTFREEGDDIGDLDQRSILGNQLRTRTQRLRTWRFRTKPISNSVGEALRKWLEGDGQHWKFSSDGDATTFSAAGVTNSAAASYSVAASGGLDGGGLNTIASGSHFGIRPQNRLGVQRPTGWRYQDGWTIALRRYIAAAEGLAVSNAYGSVILKGAAEFTRNSAANPVGVQQFLDGVEGNHNFGRCFSVSSSTSPYMAVHGYLNTNSASSVNISDLMFLGFEVPDSWISNIVAWMAAEFQQGPLPFRRASGLFLDSGGGSIDTAFPVYISCTVRDVAHMGAKVDGASAFAANNRVLDVTMRETFYVA